MKESTLPSPGLGSKSLALRRFAAYEISSIEVSARNYPNGVHPDAAQLATFFTACAAAISGTSGGSSRTAFFSDPFFSDPFFSPA